MPENPKTVLMFQLDRSQGKIWDLVLKSQGIQIDWRNGDVDLVEMLKKIYHIDRNLPDLLIMDIGIKSPNSNSLQVVPVCNWCKNLDKPLKVLLLNSSSIQVKAYEQKWAVGKCGAIAIVPKLSQTTINHTLTLIADTLDINLQPEALDRVAMLMADIYTESLEAEIAKIKNELASVSQPSLKVKVAKLSSYRGSNLETPAIATEDISLAETRIQPPTETVIDPAKPKVTTYRGVKVKKLQW
jgi:hypothetical protein